MKELSLFLLKNTFGSKMRKGFKNFCNGENSTSTLDQQTVDPFGVSMGPPPQLVNSPSTEIQPTLEEMILHLEMEEKMARKAKKLVVEHRMSCVNSSDILRSARNALNQYPRFSLDGKDAMYRSSFTNLAPIRAEKSSSSSGILPAVVGGESVIWCKPGVVGKLMGLDAMPIPLNSSSSYRRERLSAIIKRQNLRKRAERHEMERRRLMVDSGKNRRGSCSRTGGYCVMKPVEFEIPNGEVGWPMRRFL
ncbi:hypothetical protein BUALT_Bualt17G0012100 [Buddleja alternifolia]|uniref:DUF3741 domain-containing protein n=1 Tax=Buddleja alternifolia TaxID=168488 RepID=A0AAV6WAT6_9LAMI|nr:hypothetical protein BUALT_Bualt17G0012100 [Buddleja alternifolia]